MCKKIIVFLCGLTSVAYSASLSHLDELKKESPFGLLTNDYGILNKKDLRLNRCSATPAPFQDPPINFVFAYWQCFEKEKIKMDCERGGYDEQSRIWMAMLVIAARRNEGSHEFISRRPMPLRTCRNYQREWNRITKKQAHVCVSGSEPIKETRDGETVWNWTFGRYKTRLGCDSYFDGDCNASVQCDN